MKPEEFIKYVTGKLVSFLLTPRKERKKKLARAGELWQTRWFGMIPLSLKLWFGKKR